MTQDVFDLDGFDCDRVAAPAALDLAVQGAALDGHGRVVEAADRDRPAGSPAVGAAVRSRRRMGLGLCICWNAPLVWMAAFLTP